MKIKIGLPLGIMFSFILLSVGLVFSQEPTAQMPTAQEAVPESEAQWIWGDVISTDPIAKKILVRYLDYETDAEKEISIDVDDNTTYENAKSIDEIRPKDTLSIDYTITPDGKNLAKNISVERPEGAEVLPEESVQEEPKVVPGLE